MHILFVSQYFHPEVGATQTRIREFAKACRQHGHRVTVLTELPNHPAGVIPPEYRGRWIAREVVDDFDVLRVWVWASPNKTVFTRMRFYGSFLVMATLAGLRGMPPVDLVFATSPPLSVGLIGWVIARLRGARFMLDIRDLWPAVVEAVGAVRQPAAIRLMEALERFLYRRADHVTAVTRGFVTHIQAIVERPERVSWLPNGAATDLFDPARRDDALRARLGIDGFVVTFAGLHGLAQGLDTVLAAAERLRDEPIVFVLIGDGPAKPALLDSARARGLTNVRFLDTVPIAEIAPYLVASDVLLVPLRADPVFHTFVPSKLYDALACARPVVLSVDGEARAILEESGGGVCCPPGDPERLAHALVALARMPEEARAQMGERGRAFVLRHFTRATQAAALVRLASAVVATHDGVRRAGGRSPEIDAS